MQWKDVAGVLQKTVGPAANLAAQVLTGNVPGAVATVGGWLGAALSVPSDPAAVAAALQSNSEAALKLQQLLADKEIKLQQMIADQALAQITADVEALKSVNETMRVEAGSEHWAQYSWRPFIGFCFGLAFLVVSALACVLAYLATLGGKPEAIAAIPQLVGAFSTLFAIPGAVLGVSAWHRGVQKVEAARAAPLAR